nr:MAG TPA: hypothetical protein [Caudoviricetes sp.]
MLTKEERKAIAERMSEEFDFTEDNEVYEALIGEEIPDNTSWKTDCKVVRNRLIELCDTSSMIELPLDKDGQVIHIGDTVFDDYGSEWVVNGIKFNSNGVLIDTYFDGNCNKLLPYELTHKQPATIESLVERVRDVLENTDVIDALDDFRTGKFYDELLAICGELERLSDNDE